MVVEINPKLLNELKEILSKYPGSEKYTEEDYVESYRNLTAFGEILYDFAKTEYKRKKKLEEFPDGFLLTEMNEEGTYTCSICSRQVSATNMWFDKYGLRCVDCSRALKEGVLTPEICTNRDSWYSEWDLKSKFGIHPATRDKYIRNGKLVAFVVKDTENKIVAKIFPKKENSWLETKILNKEN